MYVQMIPDDLLEFEQLLGKGQFGEVFLGYLRGRDKDGNPTREQVAIKTTNCTRDSNFSLVIVHC